MAIVLSDRVKETTITSGSGDVILGGAYGGFQTFSNGIGDGNQTYYCIENATRWEVGIGTYSSVGNSISRDTVLASSNGGRVNLDGISNVFCTIPANRVVFSEADGSIDLSEFSVNFPNSMSFRDATVSGTLTHIPYDNQVTRFIKSDSGNYFQAYMNDTQRTVALYTDSTSSPQWRLGLKTSPDYVNAPPAYAYIFAEDGDIGLYADSTNNLQLSNSAGFRVTHKSNGLSK